MDAPDVRAEDADSLDRVTVAGADEVGRIEVDHQGRGGDLCETRREDIGRL